MSERVPLRNGVMKSGVVADATPLALEAIGGDAPDLQAALEAAKLPTDDLTADGRSFFRIRRGDRTLGFGGYERYRENVLLRSIVIAAEARGRGIGREATDLLLWRAAAEGARRAYLLTETAAPFFEKMGFVRVERASAPAEILATRQASALCPATAALLTMTLPA